MGVWNCYTPETYIPAFQAIKRRIDEKGATNIYTVWQGANWTVEITEPPMAATHNAADEGHLDRWYPGDEYVDIVGLSHFEGATWQTYAWTPDCITQRNETYEKSPRELQTEILDFARAHNKKVLIAEAAPKAFDLANNTARCTGGPSPAGGITNVTSEEIWDTWFVDFFTYIEENNDVIAAVAYINANWHEQPQWRCVAGDNSCGNGYWGDFKNSK